MMFVDVANFGDRIGPGCVGPDEHHKLTGNEQFAVFGSFEDPTVYLPVLQVMCVRVDLNIQL